METPKLEFAQIAPYLPYNLQATAGNTDVFTIKFATNDWVSPSMLGEQFPYWMVKPCLKQIIVSSEDMKPIIEWLYYADGENFDNIKDAELWVDMMLTNNAPEELPYKLVVKLIQNHFDVYGLLPKGLARDYHKFVKQ